MVKKNDFEELKDALVNELLAAVETLPQEDKPFGAVTLNPEEQLEQYLQVRDDYDGWVKLWDEQGLAAVIDYALEFEKKLEGDSLDGGPSHRPDYGDHPGGSSREEAGKPVPGRGRRDTAGGIGGGPGTALIP